MENVRRTSRFNLLTGGITTDESRGSCTMHKYSETGGTTVFRAPVIVCCFEGVDAIQAVRALAGPTNGRLAAPGTIRGDYSMSFQENIVHTSDSPETAAVELNRFFKPEEIFDYKQATFDYLYANDEY